MTLHLQYRLRNDAERIAAYRDTGINTLLAKIDGDHSHQLRTIERLLEAVVLSR